MAHCQAQSRKIVYCPQNSQDNVDDAELVDRHIAETINTLRSLPRLGRVGRRKGTRELGVAGLPYVIVYRIDITDKGDEVVILGIFHGVQNR